MDTLLTSIYNNVKIIGYIGKKYHQVVHDRVLSNEGLDPIPKSVYNRIGDIYYDKAISIQTHLVKILNIENLVRFPLKINYSADMIEMDAGFQFHKNVSWLLFLNSVDNYTSDWQYAIDNGRFQEAIQQYDLTLSELAFELDTRIKKNCPYLSTNETDYILDINVMPFR